MAVYELQSRVQKYSWGDPDLLPGFLGRHNASREPWAELWYGAHPRAPSTVITADGEKLGLREVIARDPQGILGAGKGDNLPFLLKILAVAKPLSLQVHPSAGKAARGYSRENLSVLPQDDEDRNYTDERHKPEFIVAMDRFEGMCGFRPLNEMLSIMRLVSGDEWEKYLGRLLEQPSKMEMAMLFYSFISMELADKARVLRAARRRIDRIVSSAPSSSSEFRALKWVPALMDEFPNDMAALAPIMLNTFDMSPGEGLYVAPGQPHAYFRGCALEVMANSDNEVRAGLTLKRIDLTEFLALLNFDSAALSFCAPCAAAPGTISPYDIATDEFSLAVLRGSREGISCERDNGPEILLCVEGPVRVTAASGASYELKRGKALFIDASEGSYAVTGEGMLFRAAASAPGSEGKRA